MNGRRGSLLIAEHFAKSALTTSYVATVCGQLTCTLTRRHGALRSPVSLDFYLTR